MTSEQLASLAGVLLSLGFSYIPGVRQWFEARSGEVKQAIMGLSLVFTAMVIFLSACAGYYKGVACTESGFIGFLTILVSALVTNQSVYLITRKTG